MMYRPDGAGVPLDDREVRKEDALFAVLVVMAAMSGLFLVLQSWTPQSIRYAGLTVDRLSAVLTLLVASVGAVAFRFSQSYLDGEPVRRRFLRRRSRSQQLTCSCFSELRLLFVAWSITSLGLHGLSITIPSVQGRGVRPARNS